MSRATLDYTAQRAPVATALGLSVEEPTAGFYRGKLRSGGAYVGLRIWHGPPADPVTGELLDRSWRWQAEVNGELADIDQVWPRVAQEAISEADYRTHCRQQDWARSHAPDSALADPRKRHDPLTSSIRFF